jgi:hypothetical protein
MDTIVSQWEQEPIRHRLVVVEGDDWVRLYVDGEYFSEGHSLDGIGGDGYTFTALLRRFGLDFSFINPANINKHLEEDDDMGEAFCNLHAQKEYERMKKV